MIKRVKGGWVVVHCHGKNRGKGISKRPMSYEAAMRQHRAIQASKARRRRK